MWNAFMVAGAEFDHADIPICPSTAKGVPSEMISWPEARRLHNNMLRSGKKDYRHDAFVHFYVDDSKFDGTRCGIWSHPKEALKVLRHFSGVVTPDFSTNQDFPGPIKVYATYRMRAFGLWLGSQGVNVVNNVRWGTRESWRYCFSGIPKHSAVCIGTVGACPRRLRDRSRFEAGFNEMLRRIDPSLILVVGSANYPCFREAEKRGYAIVSYKGETARGFERAARHD